MWDRVAVPLGIQQALDTIFSAVLVGGIDRNNAANKQLLIDKVQVAKVCRARLISTFQFNIFCDAYAIFYAILVDLKVNTFSVEQLESIIENNRGLILNSPYVRKDIYAKTASGNIASDDDIIMAFTADLVEKLNALSYNVVSEDDFSSACTIYIDWYKNVLGEITALNMSAIMTDIGYEEKKPGGRVKKYHGLEDMKAYYNEKMTIIKSLSTDSRVSHTIINSSWLEDTLMNQDKADDKAMFGTGIVEIDSAIRSLRRGQVLGIMGPPKGGKTRFTNYLVQRALSLGYNVCVWPIEGDKDEWLANQTACFLAQSSYENMKRTGSKNLLRVDSSDILDKSYVKSAELRKHVSGAETVMATSEKYGRLSFIEGSAYIEDMFDILQSHYDEVNPFDVLVIDQLINVQSKTGRPKVERISEAYTNIKTFLKDKLKVPALGIMPCQLKQDVVDFLRRNPEETIDVTAGAESADTIRQPDHVIGLFSSKEERDNNIMKVYSVASRHNGSFHDFQARCYLECCFFLSQTEDVN